MKLNDWLLDKFKIKKDTRSFAQIVLSRFLWLFLLIGLFNGLIANQKPIFQLHNGSLHFPAFSDVWADWTFAKRIRPKPTYEGWTIPAPIRYAYNTIDEKHMTFTRPGESQNVASLWHRHWLGTDGLGRDVAAGLTRSLFNSTKVGLLATILAIIIGTLIGAMAGIFGDQKIKVNYLQGLCYLILTFYFIYYVFTAISSGSILYLIISLVLLFFLFLNGRLWKPLKLKQIALPFDQITSKLIEIRRSIPALVWILACLPLFKSSSSLNLVIVLAFIGWTTFARVARAETLNIINDGYIKYIEAVGVGSRRLLFKHIIPNIKDSIITIGVFALGSNILLEAGLSFLGLGLEADEISFGSMLSVAKGNLIAWWMVVFPGGILFMILFGLRLMVENEPKTNI
ncbi:MAG TPA: ABC transporter permease [Saprospiraceae bacterium]|nr:ABC transporter permease [Saprospiraceae bacterium]HPN68272.1 ABC transporter permease [Saprospiraceae bacterium]